ncbi:ATP-binding protein [Nocardia sp. BMG51109]|uniref:ATP-binding protein n=1 Tax=Nocardia sp. BMG51109 TaxID=1056816 RepID=UPI000463BF30|nr:ATP-binding protein [Nocardia sp. BMG51109]
MHSGLASGEAIDYNWCVQLGGQTFGHGQAIELVRRLMRREPDGRATRSLSHPVLVVEGARGYGKSALTDELMRKLDGNVPCARVDFERHRDATVPEVLSAIAFQLGRTCERYGSLQFPRLTIGRRVTQADLPDDRPAARAAIQRMLDSQVDVDTMREILREAAGELATLLENEQIGAVTRIVAGMGIEPVLRIVRRGRSLSPEWYGHRDGTRQRDPLDVLVDLNGWARDEQTRQVDELLTEAFLADLRENFRKSKRAVEMTLNCVVLLDNADAALGQKFVNGLVDARKDRWVLHSDSTDPLTVVATSRGSLLAPIVRDGPLDAVSRGLAVFTGKESDHDLTYDLQGEPNLWCLITLRDLNKREVGAMVSGLPSNTAGSTDVIGNHQLISMVHDLTDGHPASTAELVAALHDRPLVNGETLDVLLERREPGGPSVGDRLRQKLVGEFSEDAYYDMITCAAARTAHHASLLAAHSDLLLGGIHSYREIEPVLWPVPRGAGPLILRRLLLRQLAARTEDRPAQWESVFGWLRSRSEEDDDEVNVLHYALAAGDFAVTCDGLRRRLDDGTTDDWVRLLRSATAMPRRNSDPDKSPMDQLHDALAGPAQPQPITRLVVANWIAADPFVSNRRRSLHWQIAADYDVVAGLATGDPVPLLKEADDHRRTAELWS